MAKVRPAPLSQCSALLVKLFGRYDDETASFADRAGQVRDIGVRQAMYSRVFFAAMGLLAAVGAGVVYLIGGHLVLDDVITLGTLVALGTYVTRLYAPIQGLASDRFGTAPAFVVDAVCYAGVFFYAMYELRSHERFADIPEEEPKISMAGH